jgi:hypothetical protein
MTSPTPTSTPTRISRHNYQVTSNDVNEINRVTKLLQIRLDQLDGINQRPDRRGQIQKNLGIGSDEGDAIAKSQLDGYNESELEILTSGADSNADDLHTHNMINYIERGEALGAGDITLGQEVDVSRTIENSWPTDSGGTVAATGNVTGVIDNTRWTATGGIRRDTTLGDSSLIGVTISGGTTDLKAELYHVYFENSTGLTNTLKCTGPCRWIIAEYKGS